MKDAADENDDLAPAKAALKELAQSTARPSKAAKIRRLLPDIESAQRAGVTNQQIVDALNRTGLEITLRTFETTLSRVRRQRARAPGQDASSKAKKAGDFAFPVAKRFTHDPDPDDDLLK